MSEITPLIMGWMLYGLLWAFKQWGSHRYGWVAFPVAFAQFRKLVTNHQGVTWMQSQARESGTLTGFTLDVGNNNISDCDAQWIAIGR